MKTWWGLSQKPYRKRSLYALFYFCFPFVPWKIEKLHFRNSKMKEVFRNLVRLLLAPADKKGVSLRTQPLSPTTYRESGVSRWRQPTKKVCPLGHNRSPRRPIGSRGFSRGRGHGGWNPPRGWWSGFVVDFSLVLLLNKRQPLFGHRPCYTWE